MTICAVCGLPVTDFDLDPPICNYHCEMLKDWLSDYRASTGDQTYLNMTPDEIVKTLRAIDAIQPIKPVVQ